MSYSLCLEHNNGYVNYNNNLHLMRYNCRNFYYNTPSIENVYIFETILWLWAGDSMMKP